MKLHALVCLVAALAAPLLRAGSADAAIDAAMKLPDARNYSWLTDVVDDARSYTIDGMTDRAENQDFSLVTMPMVGALRRGAARGSTAVNVSSTLLFKGDEKFVIETADGWKKGDELGSAASRSSGGRGTFGGRSGSRRGGMRGGRGEGRGGVAPAYSNLQQTLSRPHEEVAIIVAGCTALKTEADGISGALSETNAKLLLVHAGQKDLTPRSASGTFRLWVKDGRLVKYEVKLEGKLAVTTPNGSREVEVHQTATTTLRNVDATKFDVPADAKKKLGA